MIPPEFAAPEFRAEEIVTEREHLLRYVSARAELGV